MKLLYFFVTTLMMKAGISTAVRIDVDCSQARELCGFGTKVKSTLERWYPELAKQLHSPTFRHISSIPVFFDPKYDGVAYAQGGRIVGAVNYYRRNRDDVGSMIHEMIHVIQGYRKSPTWVTEGIADYYRYYVFEPSRQPRKPGHNAHWTNGYGVTAYFFNFIRQHYRNDMLYWVNKDCREGTYNDNIWPRLLGKRLDQLWRDMLERGK